MQKDVRSNPQPNDWMIVAATAHSTKAVAEQCLQNPNLTPDQIKALYSQQVQQTLATFATEHAVNDQRKEQLIRTSSRLEQSGFYQNHLAGIEDYKNRKTTPAGLVV